MCKFAREIFEYSLEYSFKVIKYTKAIGDLAYDAVFVFLRVDPYCPSRHPQKSVKLVVF